MTTRNIRLFFCSAIVGIFSQTAFCVDEPRFAPGQPFTIVETKQQAKPGVFAPSTASGLTGDNAARQPSGPQSERSSHPGQQQPALPGCGCLFQVLLIVWCVQSRQKPIGGWLLLFFIQLYFGVAGSAVITIASIANFDPSSWNGSPLYYLYLLSAVPGLLMRGAEAVVGVGILRTRAWKWVAWLRRVLIADLVFALIGLGIDLVSFPQNIVFSVLALLWPMIWLPYFYMSKRVRRVFATGDWDKSPPETPAATV